MQLSEAGVALIKRFEGFRSQEYQDAAGYPTIGYGHKILSGENFGAGIDEAHADLLLRRDAADKAQWVSRYVPASCTQGQFDACVDFAYNLGEASFLKMLAHGWEQVPEQMGKWCHAKVQGEWVMLPGLVERRAAEREMFLSQ